jgi:CHAD domain-containing protein
MKAGYRMFIVTGTKDCDRLLKEIHALFPLQEEAFSDVDERYLDTFDWRLYGKGLVFRQSGRRFVLASFSGDALQETEGPEQSKFFWQDFPAGEVRDRLADIADIRALCPLFRVVGQRRNFRLCNKDEKTVLRLRLETGDLYAEGEKRGAFSPCLHLEGVRGYHQSFQRLADAMKDNGCQEPGAGQGFFDLLLKQFGIRPDSNKTKFVIEKDQTTNQAICALGLVLLAAMQRNLPGVIEDIDTEFLHDFRVAIRRTRALLSQLKNRLPPGQAGIFRSEFQWLGSVAGPVRDLDVCLQKTEIYRNLLPEEQHPGLVLLMGKIADLRRTQWEFMREHLQSSRTVSLLANWQNFLMSLPTYIQTPAGEVPCRKTARKVVRQSFVQLVKMAKAIKEDEHRDASMHKLRIQAKKFRYMIEFFRSFFSESRVEILVAALRGLQDDFGDFNDLAVQIRKFQDSRAALSLDQVADKAMDSLLLCLAAEKKRSLKRCLKGCEKFTKKGWMRLF